MKKEIVSGCELCELKDIATKDLVDELKKREGVETAIAEPYQDKAIEVTGPSIILVVMD